MTCFLDKWLYYKIEIVLGRQLRGEVVLFDLDLFEKYSEFAKGFST
jgi:hypothetical protein